MTASTSGRDDACVVSSTASAQRPKLSGLSSGAAGAPAGASVTADTGGERLRQRRRPPPAGRTRAPAACGRAAAAAAPAAEREARAPGRRDCRARDPDPGPRPRPRRRRGSRRHRPRSLKNQISHTIRSPTSKTRKPTMKIQPSMVTPRCYRDMPFPERASARWVFNEWWDAGPGRTWRCRNRARRACAAVVPFAPDALLRSPLGGVPAVALRRDERHQLLAERPLKANAGAQVGTVSATM